MASPGASSEYQRGTENVVERELGEGRLLAEEVRKGAGARITGIRKNLDCYHDVEGKVRKTRFH